VHLSAEYEWDPHSDIHANQEMNYDDLNKRGDYQDRQIMCTRSSADVMYYTVMSDVSQAFDDNYIISVTNTSRREMTVTAENIAKNWSIGLDNAEDCTLYNPEGNLENLIPYRTAIQNKTSAASI
jgi:hypothetical protein